MPKFRRKLAIVEAEQFDEDFQTRYYGTAHDTGFFFHDGCLTIKTPRGEFRVNRGEWIVTDEDGQKYPCRPDAFERAYEPWDDK